ncbi:MAG: metallophosphoesterase [bacterium]
MKYLIIFVFFTGSLLYSQVISIEQRNFTGFNSPPYLTPAVSPTTSITINWNTEETSSSVIAYGTSLVLKDTIRVEHKTNYHHIILNNLEPNTEYYYKILPMDKVYRFKTLPASPDSFSFVVYGDTRSDSARHQVIIDQIAKYDFDFLVHTGDLIGKGYSTDDWRTFFNIEAKILSQKIFLPTIGNHEKPFWQYDTLFALPGVENFYSFCYANICFLCLNTEMELNGIQQEWLVNELNRITSDTTIYWIFVNLHRPPYSSGSHGSALDVRTTWCPIFEKYGVDIVFCGHNHSYERTKKINGVVYIVCAGGGAPLYDIGNNEWTECSLKDYHFCRVTIKGKNLILHAIKPDGTKFDSLILRK